MCCPRARRRLEEGGVEGEGDKGGAAGIEPAQRERVWAEEEADLVADLGRCLQQPREGPHAVRVDCVRRHGGGRKWREIFAGNFEQVERTGPLLLQEGAGFFAGPR